METLAETRAIAFRHAVIRLVRRGAIVAMIAVIDAYRFFLSPLIGMHCRFHPTCSLYARQSIEQHGPWRGCALAIRRLMKCHPWHRGGLDPVPQAVSHTAAHLTNQMDNTV